MSSPSPTLPGEFRRVVWLTTALFLSYLCVAMSLPTTSVFVGQGLGFGNALAGLLADRFGEATVLMVGGVAASLGVLQVVALAQKNRRQNRAGVAPY